MRSVWRLWTAGVPCMWWPARNSLSVVLLTGTWPLLPFPRSQSRAWSYNYQTSSTNQGPVRTPPDQSELRAGTTGLLAFTVSELSLVWSLVMGDYSIPGSLSVCVTGESSYPLPACHPLPSVFYCHTNCTFYCQHQISTSGADCSRYTAGPGQTKLERYNSFIITVYKY